MDDIGTESRIHRAVRRETHRAATMGATGSSTPRTRRDNEVRPIATPIRTAHIALVAHDNKKVELLRWADYNRGTLRQHELFATGTTGTMLEYELGLPVTRFLSGPVGGDQQIGARIAEGTIDVLIFFWDPLEPQPHDTDVKALLRIAALWNIPVACNLASADMIISSPLLASGYQRQRPDIDQGTWAGGELLRTAV